MNLTRGQKNYRENKERRKRENSEYAKRTGYASQLKYNREKQYKMRKSVFDLLGLKCATCGFDDIRALQIDHVNGGGSKERKSLKSGGIGYYKHIINKIINGSKDYQILCANCNWIKRSKNNENRSIM